jgi:5-methylthioadenosine/S-adenosylhomocysteine deaminase
MKRSQSRSDTENGRAVAAGVSRRGMIAAGGAMAAGATASPLIANTASAQGTSAGADATLERLRRTAGDAGRRILIRCGTIISMDAGVGDFAAGDVLIEGKRIAAIGPDLSGAAQAGNAIVVDAAGMVVIPGMVDCHRHSWEGQLHGVIPDSAAIGDYMGATHRGFAPFYQPDDMYTGNLATALGCIDAGITCLIDNSHNSRSAAHSDAAIKALFDSGIRAVHASGAPTFGEWDRQWSGDIARLQRQYFSSDDQLVTLRIYSIGLSRDDWQLAQRMGLWVSIDGAGANTTQVLQDLKKDGLLNERRTVNHANGFTDEGWSLLRDAGASVNACPRSDAQWALGPEAMGLQQALDHGIRPGLSIDNGTAYSIDMFGEMHAALILQRWSAHGASKRGGAVPPRLTTVRDMLEFATVRGAQNAALAHKTGTLTPGKEADIVLIRAGDINTLPLTNAVATVVAYAHAGNVDTVFIAGLLRKWAGKLVDVDLAAVRERVQRSRDLLFARRGMKVDVVG